MSEFRLMVRHTIFEAETRAGRLFDIVLLWVILLSTLAVILESVPEVRVEHQQALLWFEWAFTIIFTLEYLVRLYAIERPVRYALSFYGLVDLIAILPTYIGLFFAGTPSFLVVRSFRLLRAFRVLKLVHFVGEADVLKEALRRSRHKITVFIWAVIGVVVVVGSLMYLVEGDEGGFTSIPTSIYWAVVTLTTVGYGDIAPVTVPGKVIASIVMILGYGIIAVPTGIVTSELSHVAYHKTANTRVCSRCFLEGHHSDANYCRVCGEMLGAASTRAEAKDGDAPFPQT